VKLLFRLAPAACVLALSAAGHSVSARAQSTQETTSSESPFGASIRLGTLGIGPELEYHNANSHFGARADFDTFNFGIDDVYTAKLNVVDHFLGRTFEQGIHSPLNANYKTMNGSLYGDWYPWKTGFRVTVGLTFNKDTLTGSGVSSSPLSFGRTTYSVSQLGSVHAEAHQGLVNPYVGIGYSTEVLPHVTVSGDLGMLYTGAMHSDVTLSGGVSDLVEQSDLNKVRRDFQHEIHSYQYYPVLMLGAGYHF